MAFKVFVMMPFGTGDEYKGGIQESKFVYNDIIVPAVRQGVKNYVEQWETGMLDPENNLSVNIDNKVEIVRQVDITDGGNITVDIVKNIANADLTIVDLTGKNPNVFLELGIRYALHRNGTILISQNTSSIPFNITTYRCIEYMPFYEGISKAIEDLEHTVVGALKTLSATEKKPDSLVFEALADLVVLFEEKPEAGLIRWDMYWQHVKIVTSQLRELFVSGAYIPHVLIGISNGGLLLADTCLRLVYSNRTPLISLWALRLPNVNYFDNSVNNAIVRPDTFKEIAAINSWNENQKLQILVVDDMVGTMRTFKYVLAYLEEKLGDLYKNVQVKYIFLYTPIDGDISDIDSYRLENDVELKKRYPDLKFGNDTRKRELPYAKTVHFGNVVISSEKQDD